MFQNLNPAQKKAVQHTKGPLLVIAGAGSGKTRVITYRIAKLINEDGVDPFNILALTFTNKASSEMKQRVESLMGERGSNVWVSTFHSACVRILRRDIERLEYSNKFVIYDSYDQSALIKECLEEMGLKRENSSVRTVANKISQFKTGMKIPDKISSEKGHSHKDDLADKIYPVYQKKLKANNALDFDDLLALTVKLFNSEPDLLAYYQNRFHYILVDEYQDTNYFQSQIIYLLAKDHQNICVVGDDDQSIYRWRGASIENILNFEKSFKNTRVIKLEENYRSTRNILEASGFLIRKNKQRKQKTLYTNNHTGEKITYYRALSEIEEGSYISRTVSEFNRSGKAKFRDIAVFYRTNAQSRVIEDSLRKLNIPYQVIGGLKFYERKEIKDIIAYCRVIVNPDDSVSFKRIVNTNMHGIGKVTLEKIVKFAIENNLTEYQAIEKILNLKVFSGAARTRVNNLFDLLSNLITFAAQNRVSEVISYIQLETGYIDKLMNDDSFESRNRIENLKELVTAAESYEENSDDNTVGGFLDQASLASDIDNLDDKQGLVALMTLHNSKGLEFPVVFICGMEDGIFPHIRSRDKEEEMEEERRLCYVGMTRAKNNLFLLNAVTRKIYGTVLENSPSMFLKEIPDEFMEKICPGEQNPFPRLKEGRVNTSKFPTGKKVVHPSFGDGIILNKEGVGDDEILSVFFKRVGKKKLKSRYANLKIM